jgi:hypothetical protein
MAYRGELTRPESTGERFLREFSRAGTTLHGIGEGFRKERERKELEISKRLAAQEKIASKAWKNVPSYLKSQHQSISGNPRAEREIAAYTSELLRSNPDIPEDEALAMAVQTYKNSRNGEVPEGEGYFDKRLRRESSKGNRGIIGDISDYLKPSIEAVKKKPSLLASELPSAFGKLEQGLAAGNDPVGTVLTDLSRKLFNRGGTSATPERMLAAHFRKDLPEELTAGAEQIGDLEAALLSLGIPIPGIKGKIGGLAGKNLAREGTVGGKALQEAAPIAEKLEKAPSLKGKVFKEIPSAATESRIERLSPKERLFETKRQQDVLKSQLKQYPRYAEEIAKDAAEMAARREKILGPKALETKAQKIEYFEKQLPGVKKDFEKAIGRVRALEDQLAKQPELKEQIKPLIDAATQQLKESEFLLKQTLNNAKTGSSKVGFEAMREAAQKKVLDVEAKIGEGLDVELPLRDYNPEFVRQAKQLAKKKPIPATKIDDYFTQVHEGYAQVYRDRLNKLDAEIAKLAETRTFPSLHARQQLHKERQVLKKLVDHVDAENAIHRHKLALRQTHERKLAQERLGKLRPTEGKPKVAEAASPQIKEMGRISESMKTSEGRNKIANDFVEKMASKNKKIGENLQKEKSSVSEALNDVKKYSEEAKEALKTAPQARTETEAVQKSKAIVHRIRNQMDKLLSKVPLLGKTAEGRDFLVGIIASMFGEFAKENDLPMGSSTIASALLGKRGGAGTRIIGNAFGKWAIKKWKIMNAKSAYKKENDELVDKYRKRYGSKIMKEAREELYGT